VGRAQKFWC